MSPVSAGETSLKLLGADVWSQWGGILMVEFNGRCPVNSQCAGERAPEL